MTFISDQMLLPFQIWHRLNSVNWDFTVSKSLINSLGSSVNILFIINIQTSSTGWTYITLRFFYLSQWLSCLQRVQMEIETGGTRRCPWRPCTLTPSPFVTPEVEQRLGKETSSPPCACWGGFNAHNPSSHLPLPSCSGWCLNASTSHLGLPKPVLTAEGGSVESTHPWR